MNKLDDARLELPKSNIFRHMATEPMPHLPPDSCADLNIRTAAEIEAERLASKAEQKR